MVHACDSELCFDLLPVPPAGEMAALDSGECFSALMKRRYCSVLRPTDESAVAAREQQIGGSGGSLEPPGPLLEPPGPLLTHLHTVYIA